MKKIESAALIGLGAMGAFFVPGFSETLGSSFRVIAGGERKERLRKNGVTINGKKYDLNVVDPEDKTEPADLVIIAVKNYDLDKALSDIRNQVGKDTLIMSVLNGVDSEEHVIKAYGKEHVIYSLMRISIAMDNGVANFDPSRGKVFFGDRRNDLSALSDNVLSVKELMERCNIGYCIKEDMERDIWFKFMSNVGENLTCALLRVPFRYLNEDPDARYLCMKGMREVVAIAEAKGIDLHEEDALTQEGLLPTLPPENKPSTLQDLDRGKATEVETFAGTVVRLGKELGIPTPVNDVFLHGIRVIERRGMENK